MSSAVTSELDKDIMVLITTGGFVHLVAKLKLVKILEPALVMADLSILLKGITIMISSQLLVHLSILRQLT